MIPVLPLEKPKTKDNQGGQRKAPTISLKKLGGIAAAFATLCLAYVPTVPYSSVVEGHVIGNKVRLTIRNTGFTTGYRTKLTDLDIYVGPFPPMTGAMPDEPKGLLIRPDTEYDLASGQDFTCEHSIDPPSKEELESKEVAVYATGTVEFVDWVWYRRSTHFRLIYGGPHNTDSTLMGTWTGN